MCQTPYYMLSVNHSFKQIATLRNRYIIISILNVKKLKLRRVQNLPKLRTGLIFEVLLGQIRTFWEYCWGKT